ncbi:dihydroxyacetone kinase phosphoryl donor subunit DhaM [Kushneria phosphatilytica]|uniref:dihydroxyacetone kinase phosphoryl donor subunit DhaM n=1 Tax=Kushneria phosphatilytica TaxID=657387 RepID=UPI0009FDAE61|nr:dihydroxyacetone kinase phosphoryl donor subunit DhaM [Kushneria phosphatilytica]
MIGIVIVSHSRRLAEGLKELAEAMSQVQVPIAAAGGVDDPEHPLGTDGMRVLEAIREVLSDEGALVFADIGSARLSAEMAIELLEADEQAKVHFCEAPLVEGVLAAAVQIAAGSDSITVMREARQAGAMLAETPEATGGGVEREFTIRNRLGLHARPAALLVRTMGAFEGDIRLENLSRGKQPVSAKSINGIMLSDVSGGDSVRVTAPADKAEAVFTAMQRLIDDNFGDPEDAAVESASSSGSAEEMAILPQTRAGALVGVAIAPGFALGPLHHVQQALLKIEPVRVEDPAVEIERLDRALIDAESRTQYTITEPGYLAW